MHQFKLFGGAVLHGPDGPLSGPATQRYPLAVLALLTIAPSRTLSRGTLIGLLWPEATEARARNRLSSYLYHLRRSLGAEVIVSSGDDLRLTGSGLESDVWEFERALGRDDPAAAVAVYAGPFLDGFHLDGAAEFEHRVERERGRLRRRYLEALEILATAAEADARPAAAAGWWTERAAEDPYDGRIVQRLMRAMDAAGNPAGALDAARWHARLLRSELGTAPTDGVLEVVAEIERRSAVSDRPSRPRPAPLSSPNGSFREAPRPPHQPAAAGRDAPTGRSSRVSRLTGAGTALGILLVLASLIGWQAQNGFSRASEATVSEKQAVVRALTVQADSLDPFIAGGKHRRIDLYRRALALDSMAPGTWARLADAYADLIWGTERPLAWADSAEAAARTAIELDPELADGYVQLGDALWISGDPDEQLSAYRRALALDPTDREALNNLGALLYFLGDWADAVSLHRNALRRMPGHPTHAGNLARYASLLGRDSLADAWLAHARASGHDVDLVEFEVRLFHRGDLDGARQLLPRVQDDRWPMNTRRQAAVALYAGDWGEARRLYRTLYPGSPFGYHLYQGFLWDPLGLAYVLDRTGDTTAARAIAREVIDSVARTTGRRRTHTVVNRLAVAHLILGDTAAALRSLERSVALGFLDLRQALTVPTLAPLRSHPDFRRLVDRMEARLAEEREKAYGVRAAGP